MYEYATTTGASTLSLHDALPIFEQFRIGESKELKHPECVRCPPVVLVTVKNHRGVFVDAFFTEDRKSTRLNSSHMSISYAVFCLKKKRAGVTRRARARPRRETAR